MKKITAAFAAALMMFSQLSVLADFTLSGEAAVEKAKERINIPASYSRFSYDFGEELCTMTWRDGESNDYIAVSVNDLGYITEYRKGGSYYGRTLAKYSVKDAEEAAWDFLRTVIPEILPSLKISDSSVSGVVFQRIENGIPVEGNNARVRFNTRDLSVSSYALDWDFKNSFPASAVLISAEEALDALSESSMSLAYRSFGGEAVLKYSQCEDATVAFPVYELNGKYIYAKDARPFTPMLVSDYEFPTFDAAGEAETNTKSDADNGFALTREEQLAVEEMAALISRDEAVDALSSLPEVALPEDFNPRMTYLTREKANGEKRYFACLEADSADENIYAVFDGKTKALISFEHYADTDGEREERLDEEILSAKADSFANAVADMTTFSPEENTRRYSYVKKYVKQIEGVPFPYMSASVELNPTTGNVEHYSAANYDGEIYTPKKSVSPLEAAKSGFAAELVYAYDAEGGVALAYKLSPINSQTSFVRAEDAAPLDYSGEEVIALSAEKKPESEHSAWNAYKLFYENAIAVEKSYMLDDFAPAEDLIYIFRNALRYADTDYYSYISDLENPTAFVPREEAANILADALGWERIKNCDIYKNVFPDSGDFKSSVGAAALLYGCNIVKGDPDGFFRPQRNITYGEAYTVALNLISAYEK